MTASLSFCASAIRQKQKGVLKGIDVSHHTTLHTDDHVTFGKSGMGLWKTKDNGSRNLELDESNSSIK